MRMQTSSGRDERGVILLMTLVVLLLISAVAAAILYISTTESALVGYQRGAMTSYDAGRGGLEEVRARFSTSDPLFLGNWQSGLIDFPNPEVDNLGNGLGIGQVLYITNPPPGDLIQPWLTSDEYFDWEFEREFGYAVNAVPGCPTDPIVAPGTAPPAPLTNACGWGQEYSEQSDSSGSAFAVSAPQSPLKWIRVNLLTEARANRDINADGTLDDTIPIYWNHRTNQMNINLNPALLDLDGDGRISSDERLGRAVYRVTAMAEAASGGKRIVQYDISATKFVANFPAAVSILGAGASCGDTQGDDPQGQFGPSAATRTRGDDQAPGNPGGGKPAIATTDPLAAADCLGELGGMPDRTSNWTGNGDQAGAGNTSGTMDVLKYPNLDSTADYQQMIRDVKEMADQIYTAPDPPPVDDNDDANDEVEASGVDLGTVDFGHCSDDYSVREPKITVLDGDADIGNINGCGVLLVTGNATVSGNMPVWKGIVLIVGKGSVEFGGGGQGQIDGAMLVSKIYCGDDNNPPNCNGPKPRDPLPQPGASEVMYSGGGTMNFNYNSFWINGAFNTVKQRVVSYREIGQID